MGWFWPAQLCDGAQALRGAKSFADGQLRNRQSFHSPTKASRVPAAKPASHRRHLHPKSSQTALKLMNFAVLVLEPQLSHVSTQSRPVYLEAALVEEMDDAISELVCGCSWI